MRSYEKWNGFGEFTGASSMTCIVKSPAVLFSGDVPTSDFLKVLESFVLGNSARLSADICASMNAERQYESKDV